MLACAYASTNVFTAVCSGCGDTHVYTHDHYTQTCLLFTDVHPPGLDVAVPAQA